MRPSRELEKAIENHDANFIAKQLFPNIVAVQNLTPKQIYIVRRIAFSESRRINISAYTRYGKTQTVAIGIAIFIILNENKKIKFVGPESEQAGLIRDYMSELILDCPLLLEIAEISSKGADRLKKEASKTRLTFSNGCEYRVISMHGEGFAAMGHGGDVLVVDEAARLTRKQYAKLIRMLGDDAENSILIEMYNPFDRDTVAYDHSVSFRYERIEIDYHVGIEEGRTTQAFVDEQAENMSPLEFCVFYLSKFPDEAEDTLILWSWIKKSLDVDLTPKIKGGKAVAGTDVAEMGMDLTVLMKALTKSDYYKLYSIKDWSKKETMQTVGIVRGNTTKEIKNTVDATGVGSGVYSRLKEEGYNAIEYKGGRKPTKEKDNDRFDNIKAMCFWRLRTLFEEGKLQLIKHEKLIAQLRSLKYELTSSGKIRIVKLEGKSPDFADSLMLTVSNIVPEGKMEFLEDPNNMLGLS